MNKKTTAYLKLPFQFEESKLLRDLDTVLESNWVPHFNTNGYEGDWKAISLIANDGNTTNILAMPSEGFRPKPTPLLERAPYFREVLGTFKCNILSARILKLGVGAIIKPHRDYKLGYEDGCFRLHVPIITNPEVSFVLNGDVLTMKPGECWYTNVNFEHSVANHGDRDRLHLVIDAERNAWSDQLFFSLAPKEHFEPIPVMEDVETIRKTIENLKINKVPIAEFLILELEQKLLKLENSKSTEDI